MTIGKKALLELTSLMSSTECDLNGTFAKVVIFNFNKSRTRTYPSFRIFKLSSEAIWRKIRVLKLLSEIRLQLTVFMFAQFDKIRSTIIRSKIDWQKVQSIREII